MLDGFSAAPLQADCKVVGGKPHGGVCLYFKDHLPFKRRNDLEVVDECIVIEINLNRKKKLCWYIGLQVKHLANFRSS